MLLCKYVTGLGHLYVNRLPDGFFLIIVWMSCCYFSNALEAFHLTFMGHFGEVAAATNPNWLLFIPSIYGFTIYDAYMNCVEINREFHIEQAVYLQNHYQDRSFLSYSSLFTCGVGPILWGMVGFAAGNIIGFVCEMAFHWQKIQQIRRRNKGADLFVVIHCAKQQAPLVKEILFEYNALAITELDFEQKEA